MKVSSIAGIEAGKVEIRPGLSNVLKFMSRVAPNFMIHQMSKMTTVKPSTATDAYRTQS